MIKILNTKTGREEVFTEKEAQAIFDFMDCWDVDISYWPDDYSVTSAEAEDISDRLAVLLNEKGEKDV